MAGNHTTGVPSTASVAGHPIHPALIPFPIAFLIGALASDLGYWWSADPFWARASLWLVGAGLLMGALAAVFGIIDFLTIDRAREHTTGWVHAIGNGAALVLALISLLLRRGDEAAAILPWGLALSAVTTVTLAVTGYTGGELAYRHMIGVTGHGGEESGEEHAHQPAGQQHHHTA